MNQGRIWTVVSPNHGLPLLIGSVALTSLIVHFCILSHTTWMGGYWQGGFKKTAQIESPMSPASAPAYQVGDATPVK